MYKISQFNLCSSYRSSSFLNIFSAAVSNLKKVSLELGGKSPLIIFSDCDMDKAVRFVSETRVLHFE